MTREEHLLTIIAEECVEIAKNATKALRFGLDDSEPGTDAAAQSNAHRMLIELADLLGMFEMLLEENAEFAKAYAVVTPRREELMQAKIAKVEKYLACSAAKSRLTGTAQEPR